MRRSGPPTSSVRWKRAWALDCISLSSGNCHFKIINDPYLDNFHRSNYQHVIITTTGIAPRFICPYHYQFIRTFYMFTTGNIFPTWVFTVRWALVRVPAQGMGVRSYMPLRILRGCLWSARPVRSEDPALDISPGCPRSTRTG